MSGVKGEHLLGILYLQYSYPAGNYISNGDKSRITAYDRACVSKLRRCSRLFELHGGWMET